VDFPDSLEATSSKRLGPFGHMRHRGKRAAGKVPPA